MNGRASGVREGAAFYCMSSDAYFLGAVGMVNSLRLQGHDQPIYLLDLGLRDDQRELLEPHLTLVPAPAGVQPWLAKTFAPLRHPHEVAVLIDADIVVCRPLDELLERARAGDVLAFENDVERHLEAWGEILDLGSIRRQPYVCSGFVALGGECGIEILELLDDRQRRVDFERTFFARGDDEGYPLRFLDQDVLNAVLASRVSPQRFVALDFRLGPLPPFTGLRVSDGPDLRCAYSDGTEPFLVHHYGAKPWTERLDHGVYARLLRRALLSPQAPIRVPEESLPRRLRSGPRASVERGLVNLRHRLRWHLADPVRASLREVGRRPWRGRWDGGGR